MTGDEIGDKMCAPKITKDLGELGERLGIGIGPPAVTGDHI